MGEGGDLNETSLAIGELKAGLAALRHDHGDKARKDEDFRKAGYEAFSSLRQIASRQQEHETKIESLETSRSRLRGAMAVIGTIGTAVATGATLLVQWITSPGTGQ